MIVSCARCHRRHHVDSPPERCPACREDALSEDDEATLPEIETALAPRLGDAQVAEVLAQWLAEVPGRPPAVRTLMTAGERVWWPVWLADVEAQGSWTAEAGFEEEVESAVEELHRGRWRTQKVRRRQTRWAPRVGTVARRYDNLPVPAIDAPVELISPPPVVGGARATGTVLLPTLEARSVEAAVRAAVAHDVTHAMAAKDVRDLSLSLEALTPTWTLGLVPVWIGAYGPEPIVVNLVSGAVAGRRRADVAAIGAQLRRGLLLGATIGAVGLCVAALGLILPLLLPIAAIVLVVGLVPPMKALALRSRVLRFNEEEGRAWSLRAPTKQASAVQ